MKKMLSLLLALCMVFALAACGSAADTAALDDLLASVQALQEQVNELAAQQAAAEAAPAPAVEEAPAPESTYAGELIVFAAASMTETLTEIGDNFMAANPDVTISFNFDSSGTLKTQIEEGADVDVFISAGQKQMNQLDIEADPEVNTDGLDFVIEETRFNILENKVALSVPEGNPAGIEGYDDWAEKLADGSIFMAMGNEDVPVGQYTQKILAYYELSEEDLAAAGSITYGSNVKEVTTQVSEGTVDCGIIYQTDAYSAGLQVIDTATADMCGQVIYPAAVMNVSENPDLAQAFLDFCTTPESSAIFEAVGFTPLA
ncbi:MAG: molybdate ABC transporter substrate-binding protein [Oscillospiraceae bacterium]